MDSRRASPITAAILATLGITVLVSSAPAQIRPGGGRGAGMRPGPGAPFRPGFSPGFNRSHRGGRFPGSPFFRTPYLLYPDYYDYYDYDYPPPPPYPPQEYVEQAAPAPVPAPPPADPLVIEVQGDEWVRVSSTSGSPRTVAPLQPERAPAPDRHAAALGRSEPALPASELPPAILVFRDGHQEEVTGYTIMNATLYTSGDYWTTGSWTKKIRIAQLDVPATLKLNQQRGVKFSLPSGPNEVVMRP